MSISQVVGEINAASVGSFVGRAVTIVLENSGYLVAIAAIVAVGYYLYKSYSNSENSDINKKNISEKGKGSISTTSNTSESIDKKSDKVDKKLEKVVKDTIIFKKDGVDKKEEKLECEKNSLIHEKQNVNGAPISYSFEVVDDKNLDKLVIGKDNVIQINEDQRKRLLEIEYFKQILTWKSKLESDNLGNLIDNMNIWLSLANSSKEKVQKAICREKCITKDKVSLNHLDEKIQTGFDYVVANIYFAHEINHPELLSFWEELLIENMDISVKDTELVESLMKMSQELELQTLSLHILKYLNGFTIEYSFKVVSDKKIDTLVLGKDNVIEINEEQRKRLFEIEYFKQILTWKGKSQSDSLGRLLENMNIWLSLANSPKDKVKKAICKKNCITKDKVSLVLLDKKIQKGINYVVENISFAHQFNYPELLSFWEELLIENIKLSVKDMETVDSLMKMSQQFELHTVSSHLLKFLIENKEKEVVLKFIEEYPGKIVFKHLDMSSISPHYNPHKIHLVLQEKIVVKSITIDLLTDGFEIFGKEWFKQVNKIVVEDVITNRCMYQFIQNVVQQKNVQEIDFSRNSWFDRDLNERIDYFKQNGFNKVPNQNIFTRA